MKYLKTLAVIGLISCVLVYVVLNAIWVGKLVRYCEKQDVKAVQEMLDSNVIYRINGSTWLHFPSALYTNKTPLVAACETNNLELISMLIDAGANPNKRCVGKNGMTVPIISALENAESPEIKEIVQCLITAGADPDYCYYEGCGSLMVISWTSVFVVNEDENVVGVDTEFAEALSESYKVALKQATNKSPLDDRDRTPLHWAAYMCNEPLVRFLVEEQGANIQAEDMDGLTPVQFCEEDRSEESPIEAEARDSMISLLRRYGGS